MFSNLIIAINFVFFVMGSPQLDLPPLITPTPHPQIFYNGFPSSTPTQLRGDVDRSQRYGPPYAEDAGGDGSDDFRYGQTYDERMRYGYAYPTPLLNYTNDSPFNDGFAYTVNNNENNNNINNNYRYRNHNYDVNDGQVYNNRQHQQQQLNDHSNFSPTPNIVNNPADPRYQNRYANNFSQQPRVYNGPNENINPKIRPNLNPYQNANDPRIPSSPQNGFPINPNDPNRPPFVSNQDRFNLDDRFLDRQRLEQDRRYQIELEKLRNFLVETDQKDTLECTANVAAQWNFETNVNEVTQAEALNAQQRYVDFQRIVAQQSKNVDKNLILDRRLYRQLMLQSAVGPSALPIDSLDRYNRLINEMLYIYNGATICGYQQPFQCNLRYIPNLKEIMGKSRDWDELQHTWLEYHRITGREMRDSYLQLVDVMNEVAFVNNITNGGEYWYSAYESGNFRRDMEIVWEQIRPLYELLHSYVRRKLRDYYGPERISRVAPIPEHILGNMYGQSWSNILEIILPYPGRKLIDVTPRMLEQGYTPLTIFQTAEEFFNSINMTSIGPEFYRDSILEQPPDRRVSCEPSAWDFCNRHDFRVKFCTEPNQKSLISAHHEMTHIQYFLQYRHLPKIFRNGANPAFHQAVGDAISLSVSSPKHFQTLGLLQRSVDETSYDINYLFTMAIDKVAFLPFALALDNWRYDVFSGNTNKHMMNCHYWNLREQYGGIKPPVLRSEKDFDPGAKYHVPANIPYIKYFFSTVLQFQIYRGMCQAAGQYVPNDPRKPLHTCDIYRQPAAGNLLKAIMSKGASQPWQEVLVETLGEGRLDGSALRDYFAPLEEWLRQESLRTNEFVGWNYDGVYCKRSIETANLEIFGGSYNSSGRQFSSFILILLCLIALSKFNKLF